MQKKMKRQATRIATLVTKVRWDSIVVFKENPSDERILPPEQPSKKQVAATDNPSASDLFSMFTADIIKEDVIFTR